MNLLAYPAYQAMADLALPLRATATLARTTLAAWPAFAGGLDARELDAGWEMLEMAGLTHARPPFGIDAVQVDGNPVRVTEEVVKRTPFATLLRFRKDAPAPQPRVLLVAPMSGHFATLLRGTVRTMLADHDVYITDWHNPRDVPLAAVSLMAADNDPAQPASMTLMAGPIDCRVNPTAVNTLANSKPIEWFERNLISAVPGGFPGAHRRVYPGFVQLGAFMSMNLERHLASFAEMRRERAKGDVTKADAIRAFYSEYFATTDLTAEFYLETVRSVFQDYALPLGKLKVGDRLVEPHAIRRTALLTIEGEKDDICAVGQTVAAQALCTGLRPYMKTHHVQTGVGHYGVFNGRRWDTQIYPLVRSTIHDHEPRARRFAMTAASGGADQITLRALLEADSHAAVAISKAAQAQLK